MSNDIQNLVNELNSTTPKTQMYMIQLCRSAINNLYDLTDTIEENISSLQNSVVANTNAISGLQGSIDVINSNLTNYLGRIETLETKTNHMQVRESETYFNTSIEIDGNVRGTNLQGRNVVLYDSEYTNSKTIELDSDNDVAIGTDKIITSGNIEEYASDTQYYLHNITIRVGVSKASGLVIINKISTAMNIDSVKSYLMNLLNSGYYGSNMLGVDYFDYSNNTMGRAYLKINATNISSYDNTDSVMTNAISMDGDNVIAL